MSNFEYHPEVIDPEWFTPNWFGARCADLLKSRWSETWPVAFGFEKQYDRTVDENGDPGEFIQVWMQFEAVEDE